MAFYVETDAQLARILGVTAPAIRKAEEDERIFRCDDGTWDVLGAVEDWRENTCESLQRPSGTFRPWLDAETPLTDCIMAELARRARAEGAVEVEDDGEADADAFEDDADEDVEDEQDDDVDDLEED